MKIISILFLILFNCFCKGAYLLDLTSFSFKQNDPMEVFRILTIDLPYFIQKNWLQGNLIIVTDNPLLMKLSTIDNEAYKNEGVRILNAYLVALKRAFDAKTLNIIFKENNGIHKKVVFEANGSKHFQLYRLEEIPSDFLENYKHITFQEIIKKKYFDVGQEIIFINPVFKNTEYKRRLLITGCAGFLGSALVREFLVKDYQVIGIDNCVCGQLKNIEEIFNHPNFYYCDHDISVPFDIEGSVDIVLNLAAIPSPAMYYKMPLETLNTGILGTLNTLDIAVAKKARYVLASTSEVYGNPEVNPQPEEYCGNVDPIGIRSQYDESKRGGETLVKLYYDKYNLDVRIARIFNTYGPRMRLSDGRVITNFLEALIKNTPLTVYGDGAQTRSFAYVTDTVDGIIKLTENADLSRNQSLESRIFNIGSSYEFSINELATEVQQLGKTIFGRKNDIVHIPQFDPTDPELRRPDLRKADEHLKFNPKVSLSEGLRDTLNYFLDEERA